MSEKAKLRQSHGLNQEQMEKLREDQMNGSVKQVSANKSKDYKIDEHESHLLHVQLEIKTFNKHTGAKESDPYVQKFTEKEFKDANDNGHFRGYSVDILHDPSQEAKADQTADTEVEKAKQVELNRQAGNKLGAKADDGDDDSVTHKSLMAGTLAQLQAQYEQLYGEKDKGLKKAELADAILERLEFLGEEDANAGDESQGDVDPNATF